MQTSHRRIQVVVAAAILMALAACGGDAGLTGNTNGDVEPTATSTGDATEALEPITVRYLAASEGLPALPTIYAMSMNYFEEEGIDLEYLGLIANSVDVYSQTAAGAADIGQAGTTGTIAVRNGRTNLRGIALLAQRPTSVMTLHNDVVERLGTELGVTPESPIEDRVEALQGLTLAFPGAGANFFIVNEALAFAGLDPDVDLTIQSINDGPAIVTALREGQADGINFGAPEGVRPISEGFGQLWINFPAGEIPSVAELPYIDIATSTEYLEENPEAVRRFLRAVWRASDDIQERPDHVADVVKRDWFEELDADLFQAAFDAVLPAFQQGLIITPQGYDTLTTIYNAAAEEPFDLPLDDVYDMSIATETQP